MVLLQSRHDAPTAYERQVAAVCQDWQNNESGSDSFLKDTAGRMPSLVIMDEMLAYIDSHTRPDLLAVMYDCNGARTLVYNKTH